MKTIIYVILVVAIASCGSTRKAVSSFASEVKKTEFFKKDSSGNSQAETSLKKVDSSRVIEKADSGYEREITEVITERFDTSSLHPVPGGAIVRTTTRTIKEKGQKRTETTQQAAVKVEEHTRQAQAAATTETKLKDTLSTLEVKSKQVHRTGAKWYVWIVLLLITLALIVRYRHRIIKVWRWFLYRLFGI